MIKTFLKLSKDNKEIEIDMISDKANRIESKSKIQYDKDEKRLIFSTSLGTDYIPIIMEDKIDSSLSIRELEGIISMMISSSIRYLNDLIYRNDIIIMPTFISSTPVENYHPYKMMIVEFKYFAIDSVNLDL